MRAQRQSQRGVILIVALIVMVSMTLAAVAMVRAVDSGILVAANLAFRQSATLAAEGGLRGGTNALLAIGKPEDLYADIAPAYWSSAQHAAPGFNPLTYDWSNASLCFPGDCSADAAGNVTRYVVHRLCDLGGAPTAVNCIRASGTSSTSGNSVVDYRRLYPTENVGGVLYRVTVRVTGPRNTSSYVQAMLY